MFEYIVIAILPLAAVSFYRDVNNDKTQKRKYLIFIGLFLFLFMALRHSDIGSRDTAGYISMMREAIRADSWEAYYKEDFVEKGFQFFLFCLSRIFKDPQWIVVISSAIYVVSICYFVYHNSNDVCLSLIMYISLGLMTFQMQGMRQSIAMSICLFAYEFAKKKKIIPFALLILLSMQFHKTAIVFCIVYFILMFKYTAINMTVILGAGAIAMLFANKITDVANDVFEMNYTNTVDSGGIVATLVYVLVICSALLFNKKLSEDSSVAGWLYIAILGFICYVVRYFGAQAAERISFYFMFSLLALLPSTLANLQAKEANTVKVFVIVFSIGLFIYRLNGSDLIPYHFFWK